MSAPRLTRAELYRPGLLADQNFSDLMLAESALSALRAEAGVEAVYAAVDRRDWPRWVTRVFAYECERRDREATRRELREMAAEDGAR